MPWKHEIVDGCSMSKTLLLEPERISREACQTPRMCPSHRARFPSFLLLLVLGLIQHSTFWNKSQRRMNWPIPCVPYLSTSPQSAIYSQGVKLLDLELGTSSQSSSVTDLDSTKAPTLHVNQRPPPPTISALR